MQRRSTVRYGLLNIVLIATLAAGIPAATAWCAGKIVADTSSESVEAPPVPPAEPAKATPPGKVPMPDEDLKAMIDALKNQGILGGDEAEGLAKRLAPMESEKDEAERRKPVVLEGNKFPYVRSTMPEVYIAAMINILKAQGVAAPGEAEILLQRLSKKMEEDEKSRVAETGVATISSQIERMRTKGVIGEAQASALLSNLKETVAAESTAPTSVLDAPNVPAAAETIRMPPEDLRGMIGSLKEQGLLSGEEADAVESRLAPDVDPAVAAERKKPVVLDGREIPYSRTTMSEAYIRAMAGILLRQGVLLGSEADVLQARFEAKGTTDRLSEGIAREVARNVREQLKKEVREEVAKEAKNNPIPEWTKRFRLSGDFRLRYDGAFMGSGNADLFRADQPTQVLNTHENRHRLRIRARLSMNAKVTDEVDAALRLATGTLTDPVSTNQTLGDYQNKKNFLLDLAYVRWKPTRELTFWGGRMPNPWFSTDLVWDPDINFDGVAGTYAREIGPSLGGFLTLGAFSLQEVEFSQRDKWLFGGQVGAEYAPRKELSARLGVGYYAYLNIVGKPNDPSIPGQQDFTAPLFQQKGNTLFDIDPSTAIKTALASEFKELNVTGSFDVGFWDPVRFVFLGDYVKNLGFDKGDVVRRTGVADIKNETTGYQVGVAVGYPTLERPGDWKGFLFYKHLEADAVVDAFADSDFHLGGTNAEGFVLGGEYGLARNVWLSAKWLSANEISGPPLSIDVMLVDLNVRF